MIGREALQWAAGIFGADRRLEAELLLGKVLQKNRAMMLAHDDEELTAEAYAEFCNLVKRRQQQEPLQYLLGTTNFMGMDFKVTPAVLIPRFDTEQLVEHCLELMKGIDSPVMVDVCTGSGAIAISLDKYIKNSTTYASDLSPDAVAVAKENNALQGTHVRFSQGDLLEPYGEDFAEAFDLIASNPPYITTAEVKELPKDVLQEPMMALWGGNDGLYFYRKIIAAAGSLLKPGGYLAFEIGFQQGRDLLRLLETAGYTDLQLHKDWQDLDRVVSGRKVKEQRNGV